MDTSEAYTLTTTMYLTALPKHSTNKEMVQAHTRPHSCTGRHTGQHNATFANVHSQSHCQSLCLHDSDCHVSVYDGQVCILQAYLPVRVGWRNLGLR